MTGSRTAELQSDQVQLRPTNLSQEDREALATIVGAEYCRTADPDRLLHAGGKSTIDLLNRADAALRSARRRVAAGRYHCLRDLATARNIASLSSPSAGAPAWSVGSILYAGSSPPSSRSTTPLRPTGLAGRRFRPGRFRGRGHGPGRRTPPWRTRLFARSLPAELRVRHHRRLRRDTLLRSGLGGLWPVQRHGARAARGHSGGHHGVGSRTGIRRGARPAPAVHRF